MQEWLTQLSISFKLNSFVHIFFDIEINPNNTKSYFFSEYKRNNFVNTRLKTVTHTYTLSKYPFVCRPWAKKMK